jgi:type VI protein secretion system component Hcp
MKANKFFSSGFWLRYISGSILAGSAVFLPFISEGQNIGIGTDNPTEKLQVAGKIFSSEQGFKFPDGSVQTRAYNNYSSQDAGDGRGFAILEITDPEILGSFDFQNYQNVIKVLGYSWYVEYEPGPPGELRVTHIYITKNIDVTSNQLLGYAFTGYIFQEMWLHFFTADSSEYYNIKLEDVVITYFGQNMIYNGGESYSHIENLYLEFGEATWYYQEFTAHYPPGP